ncbi:transposase [Rhodococcus marinonascens]|uniref:transposase n=1 Tax=Rhodococcus marinonascens TaxID=38311 RepID=UPI001FEC8231|nr:transposase [Rhodococcus marinonascens]
MKRVVRVKVLPDGRQLDTLIGKKPDSPPTPTIRYPRGSWPRRSAPDAASPSKNSRASAKRVRLRKPQRATHSSWAFAQLGAFISYKAVRAGVPVMSVDPAITSRRCTRCGHIDKKNRPGQDRFACLDCGFVEHADIVGSNNIAHRAAENYRAQSTSPGAA